ncbi:hypothetical protein PRZ48_005136 [Zasmidium cellare]|uniref:Beta-lactamase-related domain-containing protein n=1 Tax=Zasmidium cellare TaxID=395010 RepID=A0ABR0ESI5_ZASCE|nr:hypothetical protein PRZ48_005136 [Zasmidium cellare]
MQLVDELALQLPATRYHVACATASISIQGELNNRLLILKFNFDAISKIRKAFGAPAVSYGVLHQGEIIFASGDGFANVEKQLKADADTVYCIASCSKAFVTATLADLAVEGKVSWDSPVSEYLPDFNIRHDPEVTKRATLTDICSHGTGLAPFDHVALGFHDKVLNDAKDQVHIASHLPMAYDFRSKFLYNNFMIGVAGDVIHVVTGKLAAQAIKERILEPLDLQRTCTDPSEYPDGNVAQGYAVLDSGELLALPEPDLGNNTLTGPAGFVRSCVNDMLAWAKAIMIAEAYQASPVNESDTSGPLSGVAYTRCAQRPIALYVGSNENSYGLGWFRHMLPSRLLSSIGPNFALLSNPPIMARDQGQRLAIAHWGEFGGYLTAFYTFPDTCSAVVVMANCSPSRGDPTDLIAQSLCQDLFDMRPKVDYETYAVQAAETSAQIWPSLVRQWVDNRILDTHLPSLSDFTGTYTNSGFMITLQVYELPLEERGTGRNPEELGFVVNGMETQTAKLRHYHHDVWTFLPDSRDDAIRKGLEGFLNLRMLLLSFKRDVMGKIYAVEWDLQAGSCEGPAPGIESLVAPVSFTKV